MANPVTNDLQNKVNIESAGGSDKNIRKTKTVVSVSNAWHNLHVTVVRDYWTAGRMLNKKSRDWSWK